uniref:Uronyl 2-sulfotransferase-like n=1 Tax=Phallusia mammillata TaxID=59560 RepID=A0A6F9DVX6_9ASCI|nr:uronyl 2-sulfotransferase-like [Phallusia mammillata]
MFVFKSFSVAMKLNQIFWCVLLSTVLFVAFYSYPENSSHKVTSSSRVSSTQKVSRNLTKSKKLFGTELSRLYPVPTRVLHNGRLLYNRVPKCGSSVLAWTLKRLSKTQKFKCMFQVERDLPTKLTLPEQANFTQTFNLLPEFTVYIRHLNFLDFESCNSSNPIYINIIRDPVERAVTTYYYRRFGFAKQSGINQWQKQSLSDELLHMSLEDCVNKKVIKNCLPEDRTMLAYFCGHELQCRRLGPYALQKAKLNVMKHFHVVGLLEDMKNTLKVFEALLPRYFQGVQDVYLTSPEINGTKTHSRVDPPEYIKTLIREYLQPEVEFYEFVRQRFYQQLEKLTRLKLVQ